jgi:hypothetical protein
VVNLSPLLLRSLQTSINAKDTKARQKSSIHCLILGFATEYSKSVKKFTST